jgi:hypothetical protein
VLQYLASDQVHGHCKRFPEALSLVNENEFQTGMYHFYVSAYLAQKLAKKKTKPEIAAFLPFVLDSSYKLQQLRKRNTFWDPVAIEDIAKAETRNSVKAIYLAYAGARWGIEVGQPIKPYVEFRKDFMRDIPGVMSFQLRNEELK